MKEIDELLRIAKELTAGCEKLPEGPMRDNCEKKKKEKDASSKMAKFPPKSVDYNKLPNSDGFWEWPLDEAKKYSGATYTRADDIGGLIMFLNMAASAWKRNGGKFASSKTAGKFKLGRVVTTRGVNDEMKMDDKFRRFVDDSLRKHARGDWGDTPREDAKMNDEALRSGEDRIFSVYKGGPEGKIWIITEWDGSATTVLFPSEY